MKIGKSKGPEGPSKTSKTGGSSNTDGADFSKYVQGGSGQTTETSSTQSIAHLDALLAIQEVEDPTQKAARKRAYNRADNILDKLDELKQKMLTGQMTIGNIIDIADVVASHRDKVDNPALTGILDEIDLRAQVEIAKVSMSLKAKQ